MPSKTFKNGANVTLTGSGIEGPVGHYFKVAVTEHQIQRTSYHTTWKEARKAWKAEIQQIASKLVPIV